MSSRARAVVHLGVAGVALGIGVRVGVAAASSPLPGVAVQAAQQGAGLNAIAPFGVQILSTDDGDRTILPTPEHAARVIVGCPLGEAPAPATPSSAMITVGCAPAPVAPDSRPIVSVPLPSGGSGN